ncbi:ribonuclease H2, subunit B [Phyllosticta citribraziliensis]|uniref:Ribonuclease H2 subunit B n=1 Tax=Phyllosticta citribraziliensis TaxID=989973 RepID=A0ABR1MA42_9PEZI
MKTRSKKQSAPKQDVDDATPAAPTLPVGVSNPPKLFILPQNSSPDARIVTFPNPATAQENRYFCCPDQGFFEFTRIAAPKTSPRSWLLAPQSPERENVEPFLEASEQNTAAGDGKQDSADSLSKGYAVKSADLFVATPLDALFLLLPALWSSGKQSEKKFFLSVEDHLDALGSPSLHLRVLLRNGKFRAHLEDRLAAACDTADAGEEKMYRLSSDKLAKELLSKAERIVASGLPASMEDKFVRQALEVPIMSIKREESTVIVAEDADADADGEAPENEDSQTTTFDTQTTAASEASALTTQTSIPASPEEAKPNADTRLPISAPEGVPQLLRLRTALDFMSTSYLPATLQSHIKANISSSKLIDFEPLDQHLKHLESLRSEALALRSLSDNISRKRGIDEEEAEARAEKKRKKEEEDSKKKNQSRGVKALAKTNTSGMMKLSSFFAKKPSK